MSTRSIARSAAAAVGSAVAVAALVTVGPASAAHATSCSKTNPLSASNIVLDHDDGLGFHNTWAVGSIYLGYFGDGCRQTYAEIHWNNQTNAAVTGTLYVNDPFNDSDAGVPFNVPANYTGYTTSGVVSIDVSPHGLGAFPAPKSFRAAASIHISGPCSMTIETATHDFSTGGVSGNSDTTCSF